VVILAAMAISAAASGHSSFDLTIHLIPPGTRKDKMMGWEILFGGTNTDKWRGKPVYFRNIRIRRLQ
jgi:hypothetical protein